VTGRVQGVGFRWWTRSLATRLELEGTVRNRRDGAVEIHALGPGDRLSEFADRLAGGPPLARVDRVEPIAFDGSGAPPGEFVSLDG
jgi:acylphosphatase